jgi:hypothetical protein
MLLSWGAEKADGGFDGRGSRSRSSSSWAWLRAKSEGCGSDGWSVCQRMRW